MDAAELQAKVLAWLADTGRGYKAASREFGVPYDTVKTWGKAVKAGAPPPTPNARTGARASRPAIAVPPPHPTTWDPSTGTYEDFLVERVKASLVARDEAIGQGHGGVARQWETTIGDYREELERTRDEQRRKDDARGRSEQVDAEDLARRLCRKAGVLARLAPDEARRLCHALAVALGEREAG